MRVGTKISLSSEARSPTIGVARGAAVGCTGGITVERSARWVISSVVALALIVATSVPVLAKDHGGGTDTPELPSVVLLAIPLVLAGVIWRVRHRR
jgi:hypothetical protein